MNSTKPIVPLSHANMVVGRKYNWKGQHERLIFVGHKRYFGDPRLWFQFAKVETPEVVWSEVLAADLQEFEETQEVT